MKKILMMNGLLVSHLLQAAVSIGPATDTDCQYNDIQSAIDSGDLDIRFSIGSTYIDNVVLDGQDYQLKGGYSNCADANNDAEPSTTPTQISALQGSLSVITVNGINTATNVVLSGLKISGATGASGMSISQVNGTVTLINSEVSNNTDDNGAGILLTGQNSHLITINSVIQDNSASINGGGIYCSDAQLTLDNSTLIQNNQVLGTVNNTGRGGGLFADDCTVTVYAGHSDGVSAGFIANQSTREGAAIAALDTVLTINGQQESPAVYGDNTQPALFKDNLSDANNDGNGGGAALYLSRGETLIQGVWFDGNMGSIDGIGQFNRGSVIYAERGAIVNMTADTSQACWRTGLCNVISNNNHVLIYGQRPNTSLTIEDTEFTNNSSEFTGMIWLRNSCCLDEGDGPDLIFENNLIHHNTSSNSGLLKTDVSDELCCKISIDFNGNTIADNQFNTEVLDINLNVNINLHHNIIYEDPEIAVMDVFNDPSTETTISCLLVQSDDMMPAGANNIQVSDPMFVDPQNFNYHLMASSPAIDACNTNAFIPTRPDIDKQTKGNDIQDIDDINGPFDIGVDEYYLPDVIFSSDFEGY